MKIKPSLMSFYGIALWSSLAAATALRPPLLFFWEISGVLLLLIMSWDAWQVRCLPLVTMARYTPSSLPLNVWSEVILHLYNPASHPLLLDIFDDYPIHSQLRGLPRKLSLPAGGGLEVRYHIRPQQRGSMQFSGVHLLYYSPWRFWKHYRYPSLHTPVKVYPNFAAATRYALFAMENRLGRLGVRKLQRRGEGLEFHQLREYYPGDTLRQIDWHATSRHRKLISKEYQDEKDQQVIFLVDCGRRMLTQDKSLSHFDHTLNAVLLLSYVALRQGDALGLSTFGNNDERWLAPRKGVKAINTVLNTVYDLQPAPWASDYMYAVSQLIKRHNKRSLVVLITNLRDEENDDLLKALSLLRKKHLVLLANLQERVLNETLDHPVQNFEDALRYAAILEYLNHRRQAHETLRGHGVICIDSEPESLPIKLVNQYLEIKRSRTL